MQHINIRASKDKSKVGNYSAVRKQISKTQAQNYEKKTRITAVDSHIDSATMNVTEPIEN